MRVLIVERLTRALLDRHAGLIASADACWAFRAPDWRVAHEALNDQRWRTGNYPLLDAADEGLARWAYAVADAQSRSTGSLTPIERAMIVNGLQVRLNGAAQAHAILDWILADAGGPSGHLRIDVVASDPYLRAAFESYTVHRGPHEIHLHGDPHRSALLAALRERAVASRLLRSASLAVPWFLTRPRHSRRRRSVGFFVFDKVPLELLAPIRSELSHRGWQITVFDCARLGVPDPDVIDFGEATKVTRLLPFRIIPSRSWSLDRDIVSGAPVSAAATVRALDATWITAMAQIERHRRVLEAWRPDVVVSFGPDTMSLALQEAARKHGIASLLLAHGFLIPIPLQWSLAATATAVPGWGCIKTNSVNPLGERQQGLVVIGHPNFDVIFQGRRDGRSTDLSSLVLPASRPYLVLFFGGWSRHLLDHAMYRRTLAMVAKALPRDALLICKLHPARAEHAEAERERCEDVLGRTLGPDAFRIVSSDHFATPDLLRVCHVAIATEDSMVLADAVAAGVPAIAIRHPEQPFGSGGLIHPAKDYHEVCSVVTNVEDLRKAMIALTRHTVGRARLLDRRDAYIREFLFAGDGRSSARAADLIEHLAAGQGPETFVPRASGNVLSP